MLDLVQAFDELISKGLNPLDVFLFDFEQCVADLGFPLGNNVDTRLVLNDCLPGVRFDALKLFQLLFI